MLAFCAITLGMKTPRVADPGTQNVTIVVWSIILLVTYSFLMSIFRQKNGGYPFYLPPML